MKISIRLSDKSLEHFNILSKELLTESPSVILTYALAYYVDKSPRKNKTEATPIKGVDKAVDNLINKPKSVEPVNGVVITQAMKDVIKGLTTKEEQKAKAFQFLNYPPRFDFPEGKHSTWDTIILNYFK